ncbi:bifunctional diaminohydroxyphosphoribosylaminopyrimidine deaminase/5-amino-6-(5-phosphoribosylamino)uracil reductase RibD [Pseudorhodoferax sp. Leaf267]|uniref:bifunctional diaminohydroxyphosphoribosylaminopyrimidine deaminase/5-amino-6-(5-phosphoribosylamino)uracil reductase RibD n=1 Tax=Pseudorhodoferax sp. Leaf267 TaxID=1736316 RepID=UPI0006FD8A3C|nr:bifunctional diaminohydroxyphosphoribosylaminopyrimidine deaminase/5-amino-6-(5-phosphoribosylamino)uracil reductase RibD [Pseudorhodoferax sp. Leaf267]KQP14358.1 diaminohydroxyphosphoribosylaminopyrimidine deaminase [Pseudorhodoferax sp. Leaf267]
MSEALALAERALTLSNPNPRVGCVIANADGHVLGRGFTQQAGGPHAEVMALRDAQAQGLSVAGATAWVTLEPCAHHGRTGPCCEALAQAGIARVVAACTDPNPQVAGQGFARLAAAGVVVDIGAGAPAARELNIGFFSRMLRRTPWVRMKIAASLDGRTALDDGRSQWITDAPARTDGHAWRARACAVLTGIGTVLQDDPLLDVRLAPTTRQPHLALVDSRLQLPLTARLFGPQRQLLVYTASDDAAKADALRARGATVVRLPGRTPGTAAKVDLADMLADLATREVNELHVEAGTQLNGSLLREGLVDELLVYLAPKLIGAGMGMARLGPLADLADAQAIEYRAVEPVGPDLRILARIPGRDRF